MLLRFPFCWIQLTAAVTVHIMRGRHGPVAFQAQEDQWDEYS
jgi:hypothetical protein